MLTKNDLELLVDEHTHTLKYCSLSADGREFYQTRLQLLRFILEADTIDRNEPPTDNATLNDYLEGAAGL
jgi:hypothetical protein